MMGRDITSADISNTIPVEQQTETVASNVISAEEQAKLLQYLESLEQKLQSLRQEYLLQQQIDS
ncbi:MAG TPA: hypothetical protein VD770_04360, partial [Coxiellaceae bacterium]|nr:hypothetical protein [Coxiellaceae bacterium]